MDCRFCDKELKHSVVDLGMTPLANAYVDTKSNRQEESFYPLRIFVCDKCLLVQLTESVESPKQLFSEYLYFSSFSKTWLTHTEELAHNLMKKFSLNENHPILALMKQELGDLGYDAFEENDRVISAFINKNLFCIRCYPHGLYLF